MAVLQNKFSWSFSAAADFEDCRRRRYWSKYAAWGGWNRNASPLSKKAYLFNKMDNRWSIMGKAAEESVMWVLHQHQMGNAVTPEQAYETVAKPYLLGSWKESRDRKWEKNAKQFCNLREHYYAKFLDRKAENSAVVLIKEQVERCIANFIEHTLPRIAAIKSEQEFEIATPDTPGDSEHFMLEGVKIYAIPDYVYRDGEHFHIIDWKAGKVKATHMHQVALYGLWANVKHHIPPENVTVTVEYLNEGTHIEAQLTQADLDDVRERISESVGSMTEYLADMNRDRNDALPKDEWELALEPSSCTFCNYYELCQKELEAL